MLVPISMTISWLSSWVTHHAWARPSSWRLAISSFWFSSMVGRVWKYMERLQIHESMSSPFIYPTYFSNWMHVSKCNCVGCCRCYIWINSCSAFTNSWVMDDMFDCESYISCCGQVGMIFIHWLEWTKELLHSVVLTFSSRSNKSDTNSSKMNWEGSQKQTENVYHTQQRIII